MAGSRDKQTQAKLCGAKAAEVAVALGPAAGREVMTEAAHCPLLGIGTDPGPDRHAAADMLV
jgi:hypothetical protein